jgi:biopolymer transport protein ExbB
MMHLLLAQAPTPVPNSAPAAASESSGGFFEIVFSGGIVGISIMIGLILLSMLAAYLVFEQLMTLRKKEILPEGLAEQVRQLVATGKIKEAEQLCRNQPSPLSFILINGLAEIDLGWGGVEKALEDAIADQAARLYRKIEYLSVIGNIAPMMGLLGTVTGMIMAFREVAVSQGTAVAADLAEGIYSALVTTVAGLLIAIPALGAFAILRNRVDQLISECAYVAQQVFSPIRRRTPPPSRPSSSAVQPPPKV